MIRKRHPRTPVICALTIFSCHEPMTLLCKLDASSSSSPFIWVAAMRTSKGVLAVLPVRKVQKPLVCDCWFSVAPNAFQFFFFLKAFPFMKPNGFARCNCRQTVCTGRLFEVYYARPPTVQPWFPWTEYDLRPTSLVIERKKGSVGVACNVLCIHDTPQSVVFLTF